MSTIKSSSEDLTLNADGTGKDIKFQSNGVEKASISSAGAFTATTIDATKLTGILAGTFPAITVGLATIWVPAVAMYPTTTTGCNALAQVEVTALRPELKSLDFPVAADSYAQFAIAFPKSWDRLALQYQTYWSVTGTDVNTVVFTLAAVAMSSDDPFGVNFGTAVANTPLAASGTANDLMVNAKSGDVTVDGSPAEDDQVFFQIARDVSAGTQLADVRLLGVKLFFTTNAENDN